jgi:FKBP-type peptidyl-prolyl cis-trans isomerase
MKPALLASLGMVLILAACSPAKKETPQDPATNAEEQTNPSDNPSVSGKAEEPAARSDDTPEFAGNVSPAQKNLVLGRSFLDENSIAEGVKTIESGLQYKVLKSGPKDGEHPFPGQFVCVNYQGTSIDGKEFDSSYSRGVPAVFPSNRLIKGWVEALGMMRAGDEWMLYIKPELAYGANGTMGGPIGPNETLVFRINLIKLMDLTADQYRQTYGSNPELDCSKTN